MTITDHDIPHIPPQLPRFLLICMISFLFKVEDQIEAQYNAIQSRINELEPGKLRAYNELLSKYVRIIILALRCAVLHLSIHLTMSYFTEMECIALHEIMSKVI